MTDDPSAGWEGVADDFARVRSDIGAEVVKRWSRCLPPACAILDVGCGTGAPISTTLAGEGFDIHGIDPSPTLLAAFRRHIPSAKAACETVETSRFFDRRFDGAVAIGLIFLLPADCQRAMIGRIGQALQPGGHLLFSAPCEACRWTDSLTGRPSLSLGGKQYRAVLEAAGYRFEGCYEDEGSNHYFHAVMQSA